MADVSDTIVAIATPPGRGGIGIVRLSGPESLSISESICGRGLLERKVSNASFRDAGGEVIDSGIALYFRAPASFTGEDVVELQGHGGPVVLNMILNRVLELGARQARPGEFTERAYLNEKLDLLQAEAIADLIDSSSEQAARSALRSLEGEFSSDIARLVDELVSLRAYVEGALDFPEEEIDFLAKPEVNTKIERWLKDLQALLLKAEQGRILKEGLRVVILGRPNAGKSSLLNRLSQTEKAIVTDMPGTTRDLIEENILLNGMPVSVIDTAGIRERGDSVEQEGMRRAINACDEADLVLLVVEVNSNLDEEVSALLDKLDEKQKKLLVVNKIDLAKERVDKKEEKNGLKKLYLSAKTGEGLDVLRQAINSIFSQELCGQGVLLARTRHIKALQEAQDCVMKGIGEYKNNHASELLAEELTRAQQALNSITGEVSVDDLLGEIFSNFCIGK